VLRLRCGSQIGSAEALVQCLNIPLKFWPLTLFECGANSLL